MRFKEMPRPDIDPIAGDRTGECGIFLFCSCNRSISHGFNCYAQGWRLSLNQKSDYNQNESILTLITQITPLLVKGLWPMILPSINRSIKTKYKFAGMTIPLTPSPFTQQKRLPEMETVRHQAYHANCLQSYFLKPSCPSSTSHCFLALDACYLNS